MIIVHQSSADQISRKKDKLSFERSESKVCSIYLSFFMCSNNFLNCLACTVKKKTRPVMRRSRG